MIHGITKEKLEILYWKQNKSLSEIGKIFGCNAVTILNRFKKFGIKRRSYSESLKGRKILWKDKIGEAGKRRKVSQETRKKISKTRKDRKIPATRKGWTKAENPDVSWGGCQNEKHWNWKGGISRFGSKIRATSEYKLWRKQCFERDGYECQKCHAKSRKGEKVILNVHHKIAFSELLRKEEFLFDINNGVTLCLPCHKKEHK